MSKVIAFFGSPRKEGSSTRLVEQVIEGAKAEGAVVVTYNLNEDGVKGCQGCLFCRTNEGCATKDKLQSMYQEIKDADGVVSGFPIYFTNISGQAKLLIDRLFPLIDKKLAPRFPGKKFVNIYAQGQQDVEMFKGAIEANDRTFKRFGWDLVDSILINGSIGSKYAIPQEFMDRAFKAGKLLVKK